MEWSTVWVSTKPLITEENWPGQGLNPGLPNDTPALYPLLHELMLGYRVVCSLYRRKKGRKKRVKIDSLNNSAGKEQSNSKISIPSFDTKQ
jgi:hypothetical protein